MSRIKSPQLFTGLSTLPQCAGEPVVPLQVGLLRRGRVGRAATSFQNKAGSETFRLPTWQLNFELRWFPLSIAIQSNPNPKSKVSLPLARFAANCFVTIDDTRRRLFSRPRKFGKGSRQW